jgi:hypothetical protein
MLNRNKIRVGIVGANEPVGGTCLMPRLYGFHPGTDAFATCLQRESLARRALTSYPPPPYWAYWGYWGRFGGPYWH